VGNITKSYPRRLVNVAPPVFVSKQYIGPPQDSHFTKGDPPWNVQYRAKAGAYTVPIFVSSAKCEDGGLGVVTRLPWHGRGRERYDRPSRYPSQSTAHAGGAGTYRHPQPAGAGMTRYRLACIVSVLIVAVGAYAQTRSIALALAVGIVTTAALASQEWSTHTW
jgi:hypothetical protein